MNVQISHLRQYKDIVALVMRFASADGIRDAGLEDVLRPDPAVEGDADVRKEASDLAAELERMGPTYVKLGQLLASRSDILSPAFVDELERLQDDCEPIPTDEVEEIVAGELGCPLGQVFRYFSPEPEASASLGQVHRAILLDGRSVAVKVQRPDVREVVREDLEAFAEIAGFLDKHTKLGRRVGFVDLVQDFRATFVDELDYQREAAHLDQIGEALDDFERIDVPAPIHEFSTSRVLVMPFVRGRKLDESAVATLAEGDGPELADELFEAYLRQVLDGGLFHADPHAGNLLLTRDGRLVLIDLGMVGHVRPALQRELTKLLLAIGESQGDRAATILARMSRELGTADEAGLCRAVGETVVRTRDLPPEATQVGTVLQDLVQHSLRYGFRPPPELAMLGRTLLHLDRVSRILAPSFDPGEAVRRHVAKMSKARTRVALSPGQLLNLAAETVEFVEELPGRLNRVLDGLARNEFRLQVDAIDEAALIGGLQKIANRVAAGLVLAALIVASALLANIETEFTLLGYPGLAVILLIAAVFGGAQLVWTALWTDRRTRQRVDGP